MNKAISFLEGKTRLLILLGVLIALSIPAAWFLLRPARQPTQEAGQLVAESFLREIREGRPEAAWQSTTSEFKSAKGKDSFLRDLKSARFLTQPLEFVSTQMVDVNDQQMSEFLYRAEKGGTVRLVLNREDGAWKVDRWNLGK